MERRLLLPPRLLTLLLFFLNPKLLLNLLCLLNLPLDLRSEYKLCIRHHICSVSVCLHSVCVSREFYKHAAYLCLCVVGLDLHYVYVHKQANAPRL